MTTTAAPKTLGTPGRTFWLVATILTLAGATFANETIHHAVFVPRYLAAAGLLMLTATQGAKQRISVSDLPGAGQLLLRSTWLLVIVAALSVSWSVDPTETALQVLVFVEMALVMQVHATRRWHLPGTLVADVRVIFWTLAATVVGSLASGAIVGSGRLGGLYDNPNTLGIISAYTVALGIGLWHEERSKLVLVTSLLAGLTLLGTENRSGLVGLAAAVAWLAIRSLRGRINPGAVLLVCFGGSAMIGTYLLTGAVPLPRVAGRFSDSTQEGILTGRTDGWDYAIELWHRQPLTGYGFRVGEVIFQQDRYLTTFTADGAHNSYLQMLLELGYVGMVPFGLMMLAIVWAVLRSPTTGIRAGLVALSVTGIAMAAVESALFGVGQHICWIFWIVAAGLCTTSGAAVEAPEDVERSPLRARSR